MTLFLRWRRYCRDIPYLKVTSSMIPFPLLPLYSLRQSMFTINALREKYCTFYKYSFVIGYSFPLLPLAEEFCRFYQVFLAQILPYTFKLLLLLTKYA